MKVYFNNSCKICRSEINLYKKEKIEDIDWVDITNNELAKKETPGVGKGPKSITSIPEEIKPA